MKQGEFNVCCIGNSSGLLVTSLARRDIYGKTSVQMELDIVGTHPRIPQMIFHNGSLISLLFQIPKILKHPPQPAKTISTSSAPIVIMVIVHGDFTGIMATMSGKKSRQ